MCEKYYRLKHNKDGSYILQKGVEIPYIDDHNVVRYCIEWEDIETIEEVKE